MNERFLIIPDIHNKVKQVEHLISRMPNHHPVFLGDYFDSFGDTPEMAEQTAKWLSWSIRQGRTHLMGNHDLPYRWKHQSCPGFTKEKEARVRREMSPSDWEQVALFRCITLPELRPLVLSHAGFTLANLYAVENPLDTSENGRAQNLRLITPSEHLEQIEAQGQDCLQKASYLANHHWFNQGTRMGEMRQGGPFWLDKHAFYGPIPGIDQIVGHTYTKGAERDTIKTGDEINSDVWFIDSEGMTAATVEPEDCGNGGLLITPIYATGPGAGAPIK
jgi:hypothetical protein